MYWPEIFLRPGNTETMEEGLKPTISHFFLAVAITHGRIRACAMHETLLGKNITGRHAHENSFKKKEPSAVQVCVPWSVTLLLLLRGMSKVKFDG